MAFRELRDFTEIMRSLGYPRRISVENFRTPNFALVADVLFWMVQRYDPLVSLSDNIETEDDRVAFLVSIAQIMASKARIMLKTKNLYSADGRAVKELLKIARTLYAAKKASEEEAPADDGDAADGFTLSGSLADMKGTRQIANEITDRGAKLYDLLGQEPELRQVRMKALRFLDAVASNLDSRAEHAYMERTIRDTISAASENVAALEKQCSELKADETALAAKIKKKTADLERNEKRLKSLQSVRPAFMDEYESLEKQLAEQYAIYLERFRNLDYLEHELDLYHQAEKEKLESTDRALKKLQKKLRDEEMRMFIGDQDGDDLRGGAGAGAGAQLADRPGAAAAGRRVEAQGPVVQGSMAGGSESSGSESDSDAGTDSDAEVSLGESLSSGSGSDIPDDDGSGSGSFTDSDVLDDSSDNDF